MRKIETLMNAAIKSNKDWRLDNTEVVAYTNIVDVFLYGNLIARIGETWMELFDGGRRSATTKSRLNAILKEHGLKHGLKNEYVFQKNKKWLFSSNRSGTIPFFSGMRLN